MTKIIISSLWRSFISTLTIEIILTFIVWMKKGTNTQESIADLYRLSLVIVLISFGVSYIIFLLFHLSQKRPFSFKDLIDLLSW